MWEYNGGDGENTYLYVNCCGNSGANDQASSVYNYRTNVSVLNRDYPGGPYTRTFCAGWYAADLSTWDWWYEPCCDGGSWDGGMNDSTSAVNLTNSPYDSGGWGSCS